ncbi:hypothetical protein CNR22_11215 [Sphingobacteriaceae bacterium]|nr:hypothetical protein CNR22_11215 [Sphingobacteriaceae bacterium]
MKRLVIHAVLIFVCFQTWSQNTVLCRVSPNNQNVVQIKWYCPSIINSMGYTIYRKEITATNWDKINAQPVLYKSYEVSEEELRQDKELKSYLELAASQANIKDLALLAVLVKSFKSDAFSNYLGIRYDDITAIKGKEYEYKVTSHTASGETEIGISKKLKTDKYVPIDAPQNVITKTGNKKVSFKWTPEPDAYFGVNVYRKINDTGTFRQITKEPIILSKIKNKNNEEVYGEEFFVDGKLKPHTKYYYQLQAIDFFGSASILSKPIIVFLKDLDPPKSPDSIYNSLDGKNVFIKWKKKNKEEDLLGFNIYRTTQNDTDFIKLNKQPVALEDSVFIDHVQQFGSYMYAVSCIDRDSNETVSNPFHIEVYDNEPPQKPENLTIESDSGRIVLNWNKNQEKDLKGYLVYRTININTEDTYVKITPDPLSSNTYTDVLAKKIKNKFLYKVVAVDKSLNRSAYSDFAIASMPDVTSPGLPFLKTVSLNEKKQIIVEWIPNAEPDLAGYSIYRKYLNDSSSSYKKLNAKLLDRVIFRFTDRNAEDTGVYEYYIEAQDSSGNKSKNSNHLKFKLRLEEDDDQLRISDFKVNYSVRQKQVIIKWKLRNEAHVKGSVIYKLKTGETGMSAVTGLLDEMSHSDKDIELGKNYTYQLRVYNRNGDVFKSEKITLFIK